ncbi:MAG: GC-type dockerin domain-anchored protein [Phycisphaerales bacterium]
MRFDTARRILDRLARPAAGLALLCAAGAVHATDFHVVLNYNWNGMAHPNEGLDPNDLNGFRSISDRALSIDGGANSLGTNPIVGATAITYDIVRNAGELDIVHLGNTGSGTARPWDTAGTIANQGPQPSWLASLNAHALPQTKNLTPLNLTLDSGSSIGFLYHVSNNGGNFQVVLGFTDSSTVAFTLAAGDWFGPVNPPGAAAGVASQTRLGVSWQGTSNNDTPTIQTWPTQALNVVEGVVTIQSLANAGLGNHAGKQLASVTFQNPSQPNRGYAIFAMTVVTGLGPPANDNCATPQDILAGVTATNNIRATGATASGCGTADTADVWYRYTHTAATGTVEARTCDSNLDTTISVFTSCAGAAVTCNDNACGLGSRARWTAQNGQAYLIRVAANAVASGQFNLTVDTAPAVHTDIPLPLNHNWNGLVHNGESGNPDAPLGYRSLSDRGLDASGVAGTINAGAPVGDAFIPYSVVNQANVVDLVRLANNRGFNTAAGDNTGTQPTWLVSADQSGPQTTNVAGLNIFLGANTKFGFLFQITNGGGTFHAVLNFADATSADITLAAPDWYQDQAANVPAPSPGVFLQHQYGVFSATTDTDLATLNAPTLSVVESVSSVAQMITDGIGDFTGKRLVSVTFTQPAAPAGQGIGIFAMTVRDPGPVGVIDPLGVGDAVPNPAIAGLSTTLRVTVTPGSPPNNGITSVSVDGNALGIVAPIALNDSGTSGDTQAGDNIWSANVTISASQPATSVGLPFTVLDAAGRTASGSINLGITVPPTSTDLGTLPVGLTTSGGELFSGEVKWFKFTLASAIDAGAGTYLDIDCEGSTIGSGDSEIGLYSATGLRIADDDDDGSEFLSQLSFGSTTARPSQGTGAAYDGRDGAHLNAGIYYIAFGAWDVNFGGAGWAVTSNATDSGSFNIHVIRGGSTGSAPASFTDLGTLGASPVNSTQALTAGGVKWFKFTLASPVSGLASQFLDIDTESSETTDTVISLYFDDGTGKLISADNDDGSASYSQLTFGRGTRPAVGDGAIYNGRDGAILAAGAYYVAVAQNPVYFGPNFNAYTGGATAGNVTVHIVRGAQAAPAFTILAGPITNPANNHRYYLLETGLEPLDAEAAAVSLGGHLATINDAAENEWVRNNVVLFGAVDRRGWLGYTDLASNGNYAWMSGENATYTNWAAGEPNGLGVEHYTEMRADGLWNNLAGGNASLQWGVVEVPVTCTADVAGLGGSIGPDGQLTVDDIIIFLDAFFNNNLAVADVAVLGGAAGHDGQLTADDIILFLGSFFSGCGS